MQKKALFIIIFILIVLAGNKASVQIPAVTFSDPVVSNTPHSIVKTAQTGLLTVTRIVDGDTVVVDVNGIQEKIRLIGVDTPETVDPRKPVQCFGKEASTFTKNLLEGKQVRLDPDSSQGDRDKYGRLLRYVFLADGTLVNKEIIAQGYGHEYTYHIPYHYQTDFKTAERTARETNRGLWSPTACPINL